MKIKLLGTLDMAIDRPIKSVGLYTEREAELWMEAESKAREEFNADGNREGEVLSEILAAYVEGDRPVAEA